MKRTLLALLAVMVLGWSAAFGAADAAGSWPQFRGPNADGISPEKGINKDWKAKPPKELWRVTLTDKGFAGPAVADGKVFIIDHKGAQDVVRAIDLAKGTDVWTFPYDEAGGKEDWGYARSTPLIDNGKVYTLSRPGLVNCLDEKTGKGLWTVDLQKGFGGKPPQWSYSMSIVADGDVLIVCPGGPEASVATLNKNTGQPVWKGGGSEGAGYGTPVIATLNKTKQYVIYAYQSVQGVEAASGKLLWSFPWKNQWSVNAAAPIVIGDHVFITSGYGRGCAMLDLASGTPKPLWENKVITSHMNSPILYEGAIYGTTDPNRLVCLDPKTGTVKWQQDKAFGKGGLVGVDGAMILVDGNTGDVVMAALNPSAYQELGRIHPLTKQKQYWTAPIVADGKLIVRDQAVMVCLDLK